MIDVEKLKEWWENSWSLDEVLELGWDSYNEIHKGEGFTYNMTWQQWCMMNEQKIRELEGGGGGFAQEPYPFKDPAEST